MEDERLPARALRVGTILAEGLRRLQQSYPEIIREVRGRGLMLGLELASPALALPLVPRALAQGLILLPAGDGSVLEFVPPLTIHEDQIAWCLSLLRRLFQPE